MILLQYHIFLQNELSGIFQNQSKTLNKDIILINTHKKIYENFLTKFTVNKENV